MTTPIALRPLTADDEPELRRILATPEVGRWWDGPEQLDGHAEPGDSVRLVIVVDDAVVGMIQYGEEDDPKYRSANIDVFLDPAVHGRGIGTAAVSEVVRILFDERGHHRITIDPAADNAAAIRCYAKVGFRPVGVMRSYERDGDGNGWHDGLLMDLLASDRA